MSTTFDRPVDAGPAGVDGVGETPASRKVILWVVAIVLVPVAIFAGYTMFVVMLLGSSMGAGSGSGSQCTTTGSASTSSLAVQTTGGSKRTLGTTELNHAATILAVAQSLGVSVKGQQIAIMTALQESGLKMYANSTVPASLNYPHDAVGSDHDSVNFFQQRVSGWGTLEDLMDPTYAAKAFFGGPEGPNQGTPRGLLDIPGWESMPLGEAAQKVQVSAFPDAYDKWETAAQQVIGAVSGSISCGGSGTVIGKAAYPLAPGYQMTSGYGPRNINIPGTSTWHPALDFQRWPNPCGDPVYATLPGTVTLSSALFLTIRHPDGFLVEYLHMYKSQRLVDVGDTVQAGQQIGVVGNVPPSSGCHLDIRINKNGTTNQAVAQLRDATALGAPAQYAGYVEPEEFFRLYGLELCPADGSCRRL
ncbi:M23 family metallopeptidase [Microbacterium oleivorans]|uniref:M23 family metallopeptidase n=1 Tax=Microbacterium oleivorans TaxID=273677 RepID=UPI00080E1727|nr:M23 family metallopeptidase [Microbacterium oleivorans]